MPYTVNGVGTTYFGTWNRQTQDGVCESCHRRGKLISYETWHCICVLFIPLIPLGKKQILDYCPSCSRHRVLPFKDWVKIRDQAIGETATQFSASPDDPDKAMEMHATLAAFQKQDEATRLANMIEEKFPENARVQFYLAAWYERTGKGAKGNKLFLRAFELDSADIAIRRAALLTFVEEGNVDQAKTMLQPFLPGTDHFEPAMFYALATGFQKQGRHQEAVHTLRMLLDASPGLKTDKTFRKALAISEKALGVEELTIPSDPFYKSSAFRWAMVIIGVLGALGYWNTYIASHRTLTVVNGLKGAITITIDGGNPVQVPGNSQIPVSIAEGKHEATVTVPANQFPKVVFDMSSGWWERYVRRPVFILDPTKSAAILWEQATYVAAGAGGNAAGSLHELRLGESYTSRSHVDYQFAEFPDTIKLDKKSGEVVKTRLAVLREDVSDLVQHGHALGLAPASMLQFIQTHLQESPEREDLLPIFTYWSIQANRTRECREFFSRHLTDRPVRIEWHRMYQTVATQGLPASEARQQQEQLRQEYDKLLEAEPQDASLLYLRGRLEGHGRLSSPYFERSLAANPDHPYTLSAISRDRLVQGDFNSAVELITKANATKPKDPQFKHSLVRAQFAAGDLEGLEKTARSDLVASPLNPTAMEMLLKVLVMTDRAQDAEREFETFTTKYQQIVPGRFHTLIRPLRLTFSAIKGDFEQIDREVGSLPDPEVRLPAIQAKLQLGQLPELPDVQPMEGAYLALCRELVARSLSNAEQTAASRESALALLDQSSDDDWAAADVLREVATVKWDDVEDLTCEPIHKAVLLVVIAGERPDLKSRALDLAEKLNFDLEFPHFLLKSQIADLRK